MHGNDFSDPLRFRGLRPAAACHLGDCCSFRIWQSVAGWEMGRGRPKGLPKTGGGSRKGRPNRINRDIKEMVLAAINELGGTKYLAEQAQKNPALFLALVGRVLPHTVKHCC